MAEDETNVSLDSVILQTLEGQGHRPVPAEPVSNGTVDQNLAKMAQQLNIRFRCRHCRQDELTYQSLVFCRGCNNSFHRACFKLYEDHDGSAPRPHCKDSTDLRMHILVSHLHNSKVSETDLLQQLRDDRSHKWIGIPESTGDHDIKPELLLYSDLIKQLTNADTAQPLLRLPRKQYPRLISFIGDTGVGKSTIIRNLIRLILISQTSGALETSPVPVVGTSCRPELSTSEGIHLYTDPKTFVTERPIFYAGTRAAVHDHLSRMAVRVIPNSSRRGSQSSREVRPMRVSSMPLLWSENSKHWPSDVVEKIYPRFLYIFSDIVCYVSANLKTAEKDMEQLIGWAFDAHNGTANQEVKPALLYIINQDNLSDFETWSDIDKATQTILAKLRKSERFAAEQRLWRARGRHIETADQLLLCYYKSIKVIFIPQFLPDHPVCEASDVYKQYKVLYRQIIDLSRVSSDLREKEGVLFDLDTLSRHSMKVLDSLANDFESSVDLHELAEPFQAYPTNFKSHVLNFLVRLYEFSPRENDTGYQVIGGETSLFRKSIKYIATCIVGEIARTPRDRGTPQELLSSYIQQWKEILEEFQWSRCRCEEMSRGYRCMNYEKSHSKGHQFDMKSSGRLKLGEFKSGFSNAIPSLHDEFSNQLPSLLRKLFSTNATTLWRRNLKADSVMTGVSKIRSNMTCLTCLTRTPIYTLPCCNHCICDICATSFSAGNQTKDYNLVIPHCPLGCEWSVGEWQIRRKPSEAGVRILSLDGGGVRGIIELAILRSIMDKIGHSIPIQELFDLVVGTSTGGIIALGIFKKGWSINEAIQNFELLVKDAFRKRFPLKWIEIIPGAHLGAQLLCTYLYQSDGIETALKTAFGKDSRLFGDVILDKSEPCKIALVATSQEEERPVLLTNYNREWRVNGDEQNNLRREEKPEDELKTWETARCTSAAPTYFQPYKHQATDRMYVDGGMEKNNPVSIADSERKFIWPDESENSRDIIVSIGTGYATDFSGEASPQAPPPSQMLQPLERLGIIAKIATLRLVLHNTTNCQKMWNAYRHSLGPDRALVSKCHRVNVPYGPGQRLAGLDAVPQMPAMKAEALRFLEQDSRAVSAAPQREAAALIALIARQLVASLFYFQLVTLEALDRDEDVCAGLIRCRLSASCAAQMESLIQASPSFRLYEGDGGDYAAVKLDGAS